MVTSAVGAAFCWSEVTSASPGSSRSLAAIRGVQAFSSSRLVSVSVYWYCAREMRPPTLMSWPACMYRVMPGTFASLGRSRAITWSAVAARPSSTDFRPMNMLPELKVLAPACMPKAVTSGSWRTMSATASMRPCMASDDVSCPATAEPKMKPVSCCGKKPLGIMM